MAQGVKFPEKFPRCIANDNEYSTIEDAIKHLHELYPGKSNAEILEWLKGFKHNKKLYGRITDIVTHLTKEQVAIATRYKDNASSSRVKKSRSFGGYTRSGD